MSFYQDIVGKKLSYLGHNVTILTTSLEDRPKVKVEIDDTQIKTEFLENTTPDKYSEEFWLASAKRCFELNKEGKLDVAIGSSLGALGLIKKHGRIRPFPLVNVFHNTYSTNKGLREGFSLRPRKIIQKILWKKRQKEKKINWLNRVKPLLLDSDLVIVPSDHLRENLASDLSINVDEKQFIKSKITVIHNGIDEHQFKPLILIERNDFKNQILEKHGLNKGINPLIVFIGRISPQKGLTYLLDSLNLLKKKNYNFNCIIGGRSKDNGYLKLLESKIKRYALGDYIKIEPSGVPSVVDYYSASDIVIHPSIFDEGLSYSLLESMASGCAIIITESGGNTEAIENGLNGLMVPKKDSKSLMRAIVKIIEDPLFAEKIRTKARETILDKFTITKHTEMLLENIEQIMN